MERLYTDMCLVMVTDVVLESRGERVTVAELHPLQLFCVLALLFSPVIAAKTLVQVYPDLPDIILQDRGKLYYLEIFSICI